MSYTKPRYRARRRWPATILGLAFKLAVCASICVASVQWSRALERGRGREIERIYVGTPVPTLCQRDNGVWRRCPWLVDDDDLGVVQYRPSS